jgi:ketosteroid isomerase-like protein
VSDPTEQIRALRDASNRAIAAHDAERCTAMMDPDVTLAVAGGPTLRGRTAVRDAFAEQFADPRFDRYVRTPELITRETPTVVRERGHWVGRWRLGADRHEQGGSYEAEWRLGALGWMVVAETYLEGG